jgi:hypothetical protein
MLSGEQNAWSRARASAISSLYAPYTDLAAVLRHDWRGGTAQQDQKSGKNVSL